MSMSIDQIRREELKLSIKKSSINVNVLRNLIAKLPTKYEVKTFRNEKWDILTLTGIIHKIVTDRATTAKTLLALQTDIGAVDIEYFKRLRLAYGWNSFIIEKTGVPVAERRGDAQLCRDLIYLIEEEFGLEPNPETYIELTQEFLDRRNDKAQDIVLSASEEDKAYKDFLALLTE